MSTFCASPCLKSSAFKVLYLVAFIVSLAGILGSAFTNMQLGKTVDAFIIDMTGAPRILNGLLAMCAIAVFAVGVSAQFFRIYVTLEMLEETEWMRDAYFRRLSTCARTGEFVIRVAIIFLGSMTAAKLFHVRFDNPDAPWALPLYLTFFYGTLVGWSVFVCSLTAIKIWTFLWSDVPMLVGCIGLTLLACCDPAGTDLVMPYVVVYLILGCFLCFVLARDLFWKGGFYLYMGHFLITAISVWQGTIRHENAVKRLPQWIKGRYPIVVEAHRRTLDKLVRDSADKWQRKSDAWTLSRRKRVLDWCNVALRRRFVWHAAGTKALMCSEKVLTRIDLAMAAFIKDAPGAEPSANLGQPLNGDKAVATSTAEPASTETEDR